MGSEEDDRKTIHYYYYIPLIVLIVMNFIISLFFFILFIKSKAFKKYQCYNLIIFILVILLDCLVRIIPFSDEDNTHIVFFHPIILSYPVFLKISMIFEWFCGSKEAFPY